MFILISVSDMNDQADSLIESGQFDTASIQEKRQSINERYERIKNLAAHRQARLNEANTLHQFFRDIADEESWIKLELFSNLLCFEILATLVILYVDMIL